MSWSAGSKEHISREVAYLDACTGLAAFRSADPWTRGSRTRGSLAVNYFSREHFWLHQLNIRAQHGEHQHFFAAVDRFLVLPSFHLPLTNWAVASLHPPNMSSNAALRQRGGKKGATDAETTPSVDADEVINQFKGVAKETVQREWDYKLALVVITILAFITRFWGISHPNQVVFDEVHFGKVRTQDY